MCVWEAPVPPPCTQLCKESRWDGKVLFPQPCLELGTLSGDCFVSQKSVLISPGKYQLIPVQIRIWALMVWSVHHWHCVARAELTGAGAAGSSPWGCHHGVS